jgi:hypothetical protein
MLLAMMQRSIIPNDFSNTRATELDPSWAKGYSRLAQIYVAQFRYFEAMQAYEKAIPLCDERQKEINKAHQDNLKQKIENPKYLGGNIMSAKKAEKGWYIKRMEADIPDPKKYNSTNPCPLGYLTAADKVYIAFPLYHDRC